MTTIRSATKRRSANLIQPMPSQPGYSPFAVLYGVRGGGKSQLRMMVQHPDIDFLNEPREFTSKHWDDLKARPVDHSLWLQEFPAPSNEFIKFIDHHRPANLRNGKLFATFDDLYTFALTFRMSLYRFHTGDVEHFIRRMPAIPICHSSAGPIRNDPRFGLVDYGSRKLPHDQFKLLEIKFEFVTPWLTPETEQMWRDLYKYLEM